MQRGNLRIYLRNLDTDEKIQQ